MATGTPTFTVRRAGKTIIEKAGEQSISEANAWADFNVFAGSAE
jgi:hypothetical protein